MGLALSLAVAQRDIAGNLLVVGGFEVVGNGGPSIHQSVYSEGFWVSRHLVIDHSPEWKCEDGVSRLLDGQGCRATARDALVEHAVHRNLSQSF